MVKKEEVQQTIENRVNDKASPEEFLGILRTISPGTHFRTGLAGVLKAQKGALIVVENKFIWPLVDGGFRVNARFTPQRLIELSKMDGAIILSSDMKRIVLANSVLHPMSKIVSQETGTRHKAAERTAKQVGTLVIAVSERRNEITIFYKNIRKMLRDSSEVLRDANEHIQVIEKQRSLFDLNVEKLTGLELRNYPSLQQAIFSIQKGMVVLKLAEELEKLIIELGKEGTLLKPRLKELVENVSKETDLIVKDYTNLDLKKSRMLLNELSVDDIFDRDNVMGALDCKILIRADPIKGWRILSKTGLLERDIAKIIKETGSLGKAIHSSSWTFSSELDVESLKIFKNEIDNLKFQLRS